MVLHMNQRKSPLLCLLGVVQTGKPHYARSSSLQPFAANLVAKEPQTSIRPANKVDLVACELETAQAQFGDRLHPVERKFDAQSLIGEQFLDDHSDSRS